MRVLLVEDEERLAENIAQGLREGPGFAVDVAHDGEDALQMVKVGSYDLMVVDLMLPKVSGEQVVRQVRSGKDAVPILVLTAVDSKLGTVRLLDHGADDYMTKPFDLGELIARCRALIRRGKGVGHPVLEAGLLRLHTGEQSVTCAGREVDLSPTEFRILEHLMYRPRAVVSKRELLEHLYDFRWEHHSNVIEAHVSNLRKKLRGCSQAVWVETLRGRGYRLGPGE